MFLSPFVKFAASTYSYTASAARNYNPKPMPKPIVVNSNDGTIKREVSIKPIRTDLPKNGSNRELGTWYSELPFLHSFSPTISGTGYGRQYWSDKRNPFEI